MDLLRELYASQFADTSQARELVAPVGTQWKLDFNAITHAILDRRELEKLLALDRGLHEWRLTDKDWNYLEKVRTLLEPMVQALAMVESVAYLTLAMVVPLFNIVMDKLEDVDVRMLLLLSTVREAIAEVLRKYYAKMDSTRLYWIALVLHLAYKLSWMREEGWEAQYVEDDVP
ncbi:hypothetical protein M427DRAFT_33507 [Gonapodya prolifera JEL478]|uniref:Uncharacterized protein n=1 Tax=Gonapodya prolifera (strain JEL478) TaxID=1344416 RepID=A0A139AAJ6_GONPJ|nr:hypothetical protein M427DRAFT_33507 [Gonapodya prolifera JEL478]|eukprot:KXS13831.1 hypothetical protein M427DRAFT_33507 [Gonapodya prolifera JEL478]